MKIQRTQFPGIVGLLIILYALLFQSVDDGAVCYFVGALLMTATAVLEKHHYFIALQSVVLTGTILGLFTIPALYSTAVLLLVSSLVLAWCIREGYFNSTRQVLGFVALCTISFAYAFVSALGFLIGGILISIYSFLDFRAGSEVALLWLVLNACFSCAAGYSLFFHS